MILDRTVSPTIKEFGFLELEKPESITVSSGATFHILKKGDEDVCMLTVLFPSGMMEADSQEMMKLLSSTWREGTVHFSPDEVADKLDFYGAWMEISTSLHHTILSLYCLSSRLTELLPLFTDIILNPLFGQEPVERMKTKLVSTLRINKDKVKFVAKELMRKQLFGESHPMAREESEERIRKISRDELIAHHREIISHLPTIFLTGKPNEETVDAVSKFADSISPSKPTAANPKIIPTKPQEANAPVSKKMPGKKQSAVVMGLPAIMRDHPDYNDLRITVMILGGFFGSRLMTNIREEKGLTYGINASLVGNNDLSYILIECQCDNAHVEKVISETKKELLRLASEPVTDTEIASVRRMIKSSLATTLDDPFETAGYYTGQITVGYPADYYTEQQKAIDNITTDRIMELSKKYLNPGKMAIVTVGG